MAESGQKMGDYTPLESNKKEYFLGAERARADADGIWAVGLMIQSRVNMQSDSSKTNSVIPAFQATH
jgi:hypothetical protein